MRYCFVVEMPISMHIEVDAKDLGQAVALAQSAPIMGLCHQCASGEGGEWSTSGELDGDPGSCLLVDCYSEKHSIPTEAVPWSRK